MHPTSSTTPIVKVAFASFIGTAIEWYDFFLYGTAAALVFNKPEPGVRPIGAPIEERLAQPA